MDKILNFITSIPFLVMAALATTVTSIDIYMPCMPEMADYFKTSVNKLQISVGMGVLGASLITPFLGPISDSIGRRNILAFSHLLYTFCLLASGFAQSIDHFIYLRFLTGFFSASSSVLSFAIIADKYKSPQVGIYYAYMTTTITLSLVFAPLVGGFIADNYDWNVCFYTLSVVSGLVSFLLILKLPETLKKKRKFSLIKSALTYRDILCSSSFMSMSLIPSIMIAGILSFMSCASFYYINELKVSALEYSFYQALIMISNSMSSYISGALMNRLGLRRTVKWGLRLFSSGGFGFLTVAFLCPYDPVLISLTMSLFASGIGFAFAAISAEAMGLFPENAGAASSMITFARGFIIAIMVYLAGVIYNGSIMEIALLIAAITLVTIGLYFVMKRSVS